MKYFVDKGVYATIGLEFFFGKHYIWFAIYTLVTYFTSIKTNIFIIEDSIEYQQALVTFISDSKNFQVVKVFSSAEEVLPFINELSGIVIIDMKLPGMNGANLVSEICRENKDVQCIICSLYDDDEFIFTALKNGALGYLLKDSTGEEILAALVSLKNGGSPMSPYIARRVTESFQKKKEKHLSEILSEREHEVLQQLAKGLIYKEIGERLYISHETVKQHIKHIYQKLHVQNKIEALNKFRSN